MPKSKRSVLQFEHPGMVPNYNTTKARLHNKASRMASKNLEAARLKNEGRGVIDDDPGEPLLTKQPLLPRQSGRQ